MRCKLTKVQHNVVTDLKTVKGNGSNAHGGHKDVSSSHHGHELAEEGAERPGNEGYLHQVEWLREEAEDEV